MILTFDQRNAAQNVLTDCIRKANEHFGYQISLPKLEFNQRGKIAGTAHLQLNLIKLNAVLMAENLETFLTEVIPHEAAHIVVFQRYGRVKPHGVQWQGVMRDIFNVEPLTRHSMDVSATQGKMFPYECGCGPVMLSVRRHNKVQRGQQTYFCRVCEQKLEAV